MRRHTARNIVSAEKPLNSSPPDAAGSYSEAPDTQGAAGAPVFSDSDQSRRCSGAFRSASSSMSM